jgi:hypothetical protein
MKWRAFGLIHYLRKLKESKVGVAHSVQGSSGLMNEAKRKKHRNRFRAITENTFQGLKSYKAISLIEADSMRFGIHDHSHAP